MAKVQGVKALWVSPMGSWLNEQFKNDLVLVDNLYEAIPIISAKLRKRHKFLERQFGITGKFKFTISVVDSAELKVETHDNYSNHILQIMQNVDLARKTRKLSH